MKRLISVLTNLVKSPARRNQPARGSASLTRAVRLEGSKLVIEGGTGNDSVLVQKSTGGQDVVVTIKFGKGSPRVFTCPTRSVAQIWFHGNEGNDTFINDTDLRSAAFGGAGNDTLTGGKSDDLLVGGSRIDDIVGHEKELTPDNDTLIGLSRPQLFFPRICDNLRL